jgi:LysR family transcriptional regulator, regulator for bpeEF and oprC
MDRLLTIQIFVRVAEVGSFTKAADDLHLPRSTVSAALKQLEHRLRTRLINRTTRSMHLTADGEAYLAWCQNLLSEIDDTELRFRQGGVRPQGTLRIDVPGRIARLVIAPALSEFFRLYPDIKLHMGVTDRPVDLIHEGIDCALRVGELKDSSLVAHRIGMLAVGSYAGPAYLERFGIPQSVDDLVHHYAVDYISPVSGRIDPWEYQDETGMHTLSMHSMVVVNCAESYIACCLAGLGLIQIPSYDAAKHLARGELVEVLPSLAPSPMPMSFVLPERRHTPRRVAAFVDWFTALYQQRMHQPEDGAPVMHAVPVRSRRGNRST